jgi:hypothetical protein
MPFPYIGASAPARRGRHRAGALQVWGSLRAGLDPDYEFAKTTIDRVYRHVTSPAFAASTRMHNTALASSMPLSI